jgi:AcrR family transcriptional regulator
MDYLSRSKSEHPMEWSILEAMNSLAATTSFNRMEIQSICKAAAISKPSFYRYFRNKQNAVRWHMKQAALMGVGRIGYRFSWHEGIQITLACITGLGNLYGSFDTDDKSNPFAGHKFTGTLLTQSLKRTLTERQHVQLTSELEFQISAVADIFNGAFGRWQREGYQNTGELVRLCAQVVPEPLRELMDTPSDPF